MPQYRAKQNIMDKDGGIVLIRTGQIVDGAPSSTTGFVQIIIPGGVVMSINKNQFDEVGTTSGSTLKYPGGVTDILQHSGMVQIVGTIGTAAGFAFAFYRGGRWYTYLGWGWLFGVVATGIGIGIAINQKK